MKVEWRAQRGIRALLFKLTDYSFFLSGYTRQPKAGFGIIRTLGTIRSGPGPDEPRRMPDLTWMQAGLITRFSCG